jgi:Uma2 family endonuclease
MSSVIEPQPYLRFHWTVDSFYRAINAGVFDEPNRLELIRGELWEKEPVNPPHAELTEEIARLFRSLFEPDFWVREEKPFHIADDGEPVPDIQVVDAAARRDRSRHPNAEEVRLVIEVADSTATRDTTEKALLYAQAGIPDYWVTLINERELRVFRGPTPDGYPDPTTLRESDTVSPLFASGTVLQVRDLLYQRPTPVVPVVGSVGNDGNTV